MSAAAVDAVRPGLRTAFAPASSPATPPARRAGQPTTRAIGFTRRGASSAMPANRPSTPTPSSSATSAALTPSANIARDDRRERRRRARRARSWPSAPRTSTPAAPRPRGRPRSAARGSPASPGRMLASSVTPVPTMSDVVIVCVAIDRAGRRAARRRARRTARPCPWRSPRPMTSPITEATQADHQAFEAHRAHDLLARGAERPQRRELPRALGDRDRQGVEDHEAADEQRDARRSRAAPSGSSPSRR